MSSDVVSAVKGKSLVYETILSSPGMNEKCKISLTLTRQKVLVFCRLIEACLMNRDTAFEDDVLAALPGEDREEFRLLHEEILAKTNLTEFYKKLKLL